MMPLSELDALPYASAAEPEPVPEIDAAVPVEIEAGREAEAPPPITSAPEGMLLVKGGTFLMGRDEGGEGDERPAHEVTVKSFWLDKTEVTQAAYDECVKAGVCPAPDPESINAIHGLFKGPNKPIVGVSWFAATKYCAWK